MTVVLQRRPYAHVDKVLRAVAVEDGHTVQHRFGAQRGKRRRLHLNIGGRLERALRQLRRRLLEGGEHVQRLRKRARQLVDIEHATLLQTLHWLVIMTQLADADDGLVFSADIELNQIFPKEHVAD